MARYYVSLSNVLIGMMLLNCKTSYADYDYAEFEQYYDPIEILEALGTTEIKGSYLCYDSLSSILQEGDQIMVVIHDRRRFLITVNSIEPDLLLGDDRDGNLIPIPYFKIDHIVVEDRSLRNAKNVVKLALLIIVVAGFVALLSFGLQ